MTNDQSDVRNEAFLVGTTSVLVSQRRDDASDLRKVFLFRNNSPNVADIITIHLGGSVAIPGEGIILDKGQSYFEDNNSGDVWKGKIQAICATANGVLAIMER